MKIKMAPNGFKSGSRFSKTMGLNWMVVWHLIPPCLLIMWTLALLLLGNQMAMLNLQFAINHHKKRLKGPHSISFLWTIQTRDKKRLRKIIISFLFLFFFRADNHFYSICAQLAISLNVTWYICYVRTVVYLLKKCKPYGLCIKLYLPNDSNQKKKKHTFAFILWSCLIKKERQSLKFWM